MCVEKVLRKKVIFYGLMVSIGIMVLFLMANGNNFLSQFIDTNFVKPLPKRYNDTKFRSKQLSNVFVRTNTFDILVFNPRIQVINRQLIDEFDNLLQNDCEFSNCRITKERSNLHRYSAIIFDTTQRLPLQPPILPSDRNPNQVWIFAWREAPIRHKLVKAWGIYLNEHWRNTVNWTMTNTHDADLFYGYGVIRKRIPPVKNYSAIFRRKTKMAAWIVSHCHTQSEREKYVKKLQQNGVKVDIFGQCAGKRIEENSDKVRNEIDKYKFYLSFENSLCKDYITEKLFKYFKYDVVLVVRGGGNYSSLLPNDSYINTADFGSVKDLAKHLLSVGSSEKRYINYLMNKDRFESDRNFWYKSFCHICEKLNNLGENRRTYTDLVNIVHNGTCFSPTDIK